MRMAILTSGIFWGSILVLIGISILIKVIFGINFPIIRILFSLLLIFWGVKMLLGISFTKKQSEHVVFTERHWSQSDQPKEYNVIFGKGLIDLRNISREEHAGKKEINIIFGTAEILIDDSTALRINASSAFGAINFPDQTLISFGERTYHTPARRQEVLPVDVELNVVFGNAQIRNK